MDPVRFHWAKSFLESSGWSLVTKDFGSEQRFTFSLPQLCPSQQGITCIEQLEEDGLNSPPSDIETPKQKKVCPHPPDDLVNMQLKRKTLKAPLVCTEVRRSDRLKELNKGFKASSCNSKICLSCETKPPTLSARAMRSLGKKFCNIPVTKLSEENLKMKQKKAPGPGVKKVAKSSQPKSKDEDLKLVKKKSKKN
jgi:hypothetical protein